MARHISQRASEITKVRIFILSDGVTSAQNVRRGRIQDREVQFEVWDAERLFRGMQPTLGRDEIAVNFEASSGNAIPCLPMLDASTDYEAYLAILPGEILYKLYDDYGSRLLELNVRSFLSARGKINSGIRRTLRKNRTAFWRITTELSSRWTRWKPSRWTTAARRSAPSVASKSLTAARRLPQFTGRARSTV